MTALMLLGMGCTFAACGNDDDGDSKGNREVAELKALLLDENGQVYFDAMGEGTYKISDDELPREDYRITLMATDSRIMLNVNSRLSVTYNWSRWFVNLNGNFYHSRYHYDSNSGRLNDWSAMLRLGVRL
ncbi:MAG: hypothetical protein K6B13_09880 [Prevotella sp.]|nr:hypothetical protein [Prevotella sp.]